jgi:hypothetical protein
MNFLPWIALLAATAPLEESAAPAVSVELQPAEIKLGQPFWMEIRVAGAAPLKLPQRLQLEPFEVLAREEAPRQEKDQTQVFRLKLASYQVVGSQRIPGFFLEPLAADGGTGAGVEVPATEIKIASMLEGVENPQPRDIAPPVPVWWRDWRPVAAAGLLGMWLAMWAWMRWRRRSFSPAQALEPPPPPRPAHQIALEKLQAIIEEQLVRQGRVKEYFDRISDTVREYLGNLYGFFALDCTSEELIVQLRERPTPGLDLDMLRRLLEDADLVKFARVQPGDEMCSRAINSALAIVEATRPREVEAA